MNIRRGSFAVACVSLLIASGLFAQVPQIINYQGRVVVGSTNFNGTGQFKFALINNANGQTLWSNDNTSANGSEPTAAVSLSVTNGLYSVLLGDTSIANMTAIPATVFGNSDVRLRVWFNDGSHGSQLFTPDQRIASVGYAMIAGTVPDLAISTDKLANNSVNSSKIDSTVQQRVTGTAAPGTFITGINADGTVVASAPADSGGTVTNVTATGPLSVTNGTTTPNISLTGTVPVTNGGTGATTLTANRLLLGNGTAPISTTTALTNGELLIGRTGLAPATGTLTGTANQITVTNGSGTITLGLANNAGTDISANLEEEAQIGSTNISNNSTNAQLLVGQGTNSATWLTMAGDVTLSSGGFASIQANSVTLGSDTTGSYVRAVATFNGLAGGGTSFGFEDAVLSLGLDYSATLSSNILSANQTQFASTGILFEGTTADNSEGLLEATNPSGDRTWTLPDVSGTIITTGNLSSITSTGTLSRLTVLGNLTSSVTSSSAAIVPFEVRGAAGQQADLQRWTDSSGVTLASISSNGVFTGNGSGLTGLEAAAMFSGRINSLTTGTQFGASTGLSTAVSSESSVLTLSAHRAGTARNLSVRLTAAPGGTETRTFALVVNGTVSPNVSCVISGPSTTCNSGSGAQSVPAGSTLSIREVSSASALPSDVLFGWELK